MTVFDPAQHDNTRPEWGPEDYGRALIAAARTHAQKVKERRGGLVDCNAWWRGGDDLNVRIFPHRGAWKDIKTDEGGGVAAAAETWLGITFGEFMDSYGPTQPMPALPAEVLEPDIGVGEWDSTWRAFEVGEDRIPPAAKWIARAGVPGDVAEESGLLAVYPDDIDLVPEAAAGWWRMKVIRPCMAAPMRHLGTGLVNGIHVRGHGLKEHVKGSNPVDVDGTPSVYGLGGAINRCRALVLCEGLRDTAIAEAIVRPYPEALALGAVSASGLTAVARWLISHGWNGVVLLVYHLDGPEALKFPLEAIDLLRGSVRLAQPMHLQRVVRELLDCDVELKKGFDLTDAVTLCGFDDIRSAIASWVIARGGPSYEEARA